MQMLAGEFSTIILGMRGYLTYMQTMVNAHGTPIFGSMLSYMAFITDNA